MYSVPGGISVRSIGNLLVSVRRRGPSCQADRQATALPTPTDITPNSDGTITLPGDLPSLQEAPEPSTLMLFGSALAGLLYAKRRRP
jgi:hypothetical protein